VRDAVPQRNERPRGGRSGSSRKREELRYGKMHGSKFRRQVNSSIEGHSSPEFGNWSLFGRRALRGPGAIGW